MSGYSTDLRERVVALREKDETQGRIAEVLGLSISTVKRYLVRYQHRGNLAATVQGRMQPRLGEAEMWVLEAELRAQPDATRQTYAERLAAQTGIVVSPMSISRAIRRWVGRKKKTVVAREREPLARRLFADEAADLPAERVIVVDETSTQRDMHPRYAWAPHGERTVASAARNTGTKVSVMGPALALGRGRQHAHVPDLHP